MSPITKTIKESIPLEFEEQFFVGGVRDYMFEGEPLSARAGEAIKKFLLQSQIKVIEAVEMELRKSVLKLAKHKECHEGNCEPCENCMSVLVLSDFVSDQISSLNETLEFLKKSL